MIFDSFGCPRDTGATDMKDSARLAGIMATFKYPGFNLPLTIYYNDAGLPTRHPLENYKDMSRDQWVCLSAGLSVQRFYVSEHYTPTNHDVLAPSVKGHIARCVGKKPTKLQNLWLWGDILYSIYIDPWAESNQLLCMLMIADAKYLKYWCKYHSNWRKTILDYWCQGPGAWRNEPLLALHMIKTIEERINDTE